VAAAATALVVLAPLALLDRYRRAPFPALRDGPLVLAQARESLRAARALAAGETVEWRLDEGGYVPGENDPRHLGRMRWYLRQGWGDLPHYGRGPAVLREPRGSLLVPTLGGRDLALDLDLGGAEAAVSVNGRPAGVCRAETPSCRVALPAGVLWRGDNIVGLDARPGLALTAVRVTPR
jgi:hypothetical protein